jgi:ubiquinone/menaquinone biosynthesis C-methylase UbiE/uncharacterized protein YbaR (Trm112 family)
MKEGNAIDLIPHVCPKCKHTLRSDDNALYCGECNQIYTIINSIPDFLSGDLQAAIAPVFGGTSGMTTIENMSKKMDRFAPIYDSQRFGSVLLKLSGISGGFPRFINKVTNFHLKTLDGITGSVLDVACGPATYGRRLASSHRNVYGIDISMGMLQKGKTYFERENVSGIHLARARVEELPFENDIFDGAMCSGALHLFPDTLLSLREISRTMKPGTFLSVQTFAPGKTLINRFVQNRSYVHTFEIDEIQGYLAKANFEEFRYELDGIVFTFSVKKIGSN